MTKSKPRTCCLSAAAYSCGNTFQKRPLAASQSPRMPRATSDRVHRRCRWIKLFSALSSCEQSGAHLVTSSVADMRHRHAQLQMPTYLPGTARQHRQ